jgi:hypothetical protein
MVVIFEFVYFKKNPFDSIYKTRNILHLAKALKRLKSYNVDIMGIEGEF